MHPDLTANWREQSSKTARRRPRRNTTRARQRRLNQLTRELVCDLEHKPTALEYGMIRQTASLLLRCEQLQAAVVRGEPISGDELIRLSGAARRAMRALGVKSDTRTESPPWSPLRAELKRKADAAAAEKEPAA